MSNASKDEQLELLYQINNRFQNFDYENSHVQHQIMFISICFFGFIYTLSMVVSPVLISKYNQLKTKERVFWHLSTVRAVFGCFAGTVGTWSLFTTTELDKDVIFGRTPTSIFAIAFSTGFFAFETCALLASDFVFRQFSFLLNLHHLVSLMCYYTAIVTGCSHFIACKGLILEVSTPFSCLCWTLLKCGKEKTLLWKANQFLLVHAFHCRSIVECYFWYVTYKNWDYIYAEMPRAVFYVEYVELGLITFVLTPYWTYKKTVQFVEQKDWNFEESEEDAVKTKVE